jgi:hypothetical protein
LIGALSIIVTTLNTTVSDCRDYSTAARLTEEEMERLVGTIRPTMAEARQATYKVNAELQRGESVCFPYYDGAKTEQLVGWYFIGNTID